MNIILFLVPLFVFILLFPIFREAHRLLGIESLKEGFLKTNAIKKIANKVTEDLIRNEPTPIPNEDKAWITKNFVKYPAMMKDSHLKDTTSRDATGKSKALLSKRFQTRYYDEATFGKFRKDFKSHFFIPNPTNEDIKMEITYRKKFDAVRMMAVLEASNPEGFKRMSDDLKKLKANGTYDNDIKTRDGLKTNLEIKTAKPTTQTEKEIIEQTTVSKLKEKDNMSRINELEKQFQTYGEKSESRFATIEDSMSTMGVGTSGLTKANDKIANMSKKIKTQEDEINYLRNNLSGKPSVDYVNSKVSTIQVKMNDLEDKFRKFKVESSV